MLETNRIYNIDCLSGLKKLDNECIDVVVTSPPYYNVREYSHWETVEQYISDMEKIFSEVFRTLKNHHCIVVNVSDIVCQTGRSKWQVRKLPLGAYFITMLENIGFQFIDDYIWDKGEPQSKRNLGNPPYPYYQYPVNCYEHILIFAKNQLNKTKIPCPDCNKIITHSNSCTGIGVQSWECKNPDCPAKSANNRGKRFSARSVMMSYYRIADNEIPENFRINWRRDIVKINPVIKVNCKGENIFGHSAPFPEEIPEMAVRYFSGVNDVVCDIFSGSGTSCIVARKLNRRYIGFEISEIFCRTANERISKFKKE